MLLNSERVSIHWHILFFCRSRVGLLGPEDSLTRNTMPELWVNHSLMCVYCAFEIPWQNTLSTSRAMLLVPIPKQFFYAAWNTSEVQIPTASKVHVTGPSCLMGSAMIERAQKHDEHTRMVRFWSRPIDRSHQWLSDASASEMHSEYSNVSLTWTPSFPPQIVHNVSYPY